MLNKPLDLEIPHLTCLLNVVTLLTVQSLLSVRFTVQEIGQWCCFERLCPSLKASCECIQNVLTCILSLWQVSNFMVMGRTDAMGEDHIAEVGISQNFSLTGKSYLFFSPLQALRSRTDQLYNMAAVMYRAAQAEDSTSCVTTEQVARLEYENRHLRELLQFSTPVLESNERTQPVSTLHASPSNKGTPPQDSAVLKVVGRNELHRPLPGKQSGEESPVNSVVNCVDDDSQCVTPKAEGMDPVDLLDLARERLTDSVR